MLSLHRTFDAKTKMGAEKRRVSLLVWASGRVGLVELGRSCFFRQWRVLAFGGGAKMPEPSRVSTVTEKDANAGQSFSEENVAGAGQERRGRGPVKPA